MSTTSRSALEAALGEQLNALLSASRALTERSAVSFHPALRPAAFEVARWLHAFGPASPSAIAEGLAMDRSSVSALIGDLKREGLAVAAPAPGDRRSSVISLTPEGSSRARRTLDLRGTEYYARVERMSAEELSALTALLAKFTA